MSAFDPTIMAFYAERYDEDARLIGTAHGQLELVRTRELLARYLPSAPATVLDVGGGPGVHARWLAAAGYAVHLVDPVPRHVAAAADIPGVTATLGDARSLAQGDHSVDCTLLLGPLYHLTDAADRALALREAVRVTRASGVIIVAAISRYTRLLEQAVLGGVTDETDLRATVDTGVDVNSPDGFTTTAYFHRPDELADELATAGLLDVQVLGVEGPSTPALDAVDPVSLPHLMPTAIRVARMVESDPAMLNASPHFLGVGRLLPAWTHERVHVVAADPSRGQAGLLECRRLDEALAGWLVAPVEHVGSTAVPGLVAKSILDLQAAVTDLDCASDVAETLAPAGWHLVPPELDERPWRCLFVRVEGGHRVAHLHLLAGTGGRWQRQIDFRDALRTDPILAGRYSVLKIELAQRFSDDREAYSAAKRDFVRAVLNAGWSVRDATGLDAEACARIYGPYVTDTTISFEETPPVVAEMERRIVEAVRTHAWVVLERGGQVIGYAYGAPFRSRSAYRFSCEVSVYLDGDQRAAGGGRALYQALFTRLAARGFVTAFAGMTLPNDASVGLHRALGFAPVGTLRRVGFKHGDWHDVAWVQRELS